MIGICYDLFNDCPECEGEGLALPTTFPEGVTMVVGMSFGTTFTQSRYQSTSQSTSQMRQVTTKVLKYGSKPL